MIEIRKIGKNRGSKNGNWKGGISEYQDQYLMDKMHEIKRKTSRGFCEICHKPGRLIHHKDKTKTNHLIHNFLFLCSSCHTKIHPRGSNENQNSPSPRVGHKPLKSSQDEA